MTIVDASERKDFEQAITARRLRVDDFELTERRYPATGTADPIKGEVTIRRKSTGKKKTYKAGHFSKWPAEFTDDLNRGAFD